MKHGFCKIILAMTIAWIPATVANAQPQGGPRPEFKGGPRPMPTVNELAQQRANAMDHELTLTEKQYKKILKYYKAEVEREREMMEAGKPQGMPEGFPGGGRPDFGGGRPPMGGMAASDEEMEKYYEKQDKKLKKILTAEQYGKWRTKHPVEHLPMPDPEFE